MVDIKAEVICDSIGSHSPRLTTFRLKELLIYDPITGIFKWLPTKQRCRSQFSNKIAGRINTKGHIQIVVDGKPYLAHRLAWFYINKKWPVNQIDHKDLNKKNNSWINLREATNGQNRANSKTTASSGFKGAYQTKTGRWQAVIRVNKISIYLGTFDTKEEAAIAYSKAAKIHHGEFARS